ncbi:MAG: DUF4143 domain-containing protein [Propionibacteriaceae bacterium]|nr:DUF4143 domain-containing protein [Propionibacteriaceae bacterium]MCL1842121.1 DUF4143 domain-containing protein [Propionibacteriaceae bacterium]
MEYRPRVADDELAERPRRAGAVLIEGAKWCGKTQTALRAAKSVLPVVSVSTLERLMIVEDQPAWSTARRDSATLRQSPKRHLVCPSLAAAAMGATVDGLVREPKTLGALFESQVVRDLRVYAVVQYPDGVAVVPLDALRL